ncbi:hypothetical protein LTS08_003702 [Lithohypha guttulata]|nr:hypothetical protein LTS08_003702 [Lithohypha guttulata]
MGMNFASDGYVWGDAEQPFNSEVRGYTLQMFWHRAGYKPHAESVATHTRRRYRLLPNNQMGMGTPDPHLWLVHYSKAQPRDQHPATSIQMLPHIAQVFQTRQMIQRSGQLPRKEFMLHDRSQWPVVQLPTGVGRSGSSGQLVGGHRRGASLENTTMEEEEDVSRGDVLDFITPREISRMRYEQHHEWMEEILESPYATKQIIPSELGLGRKGALESFTNGFFTAPVSTAHEAVNGKVGKLDLARTDKFTKHANAKLAEMQADLEKMKQQHLRRMEKLRKTTDLGSAERKLRNMNPNDDNYKNVAAQVQNMMGRKIEAVEKVQQIARGGLQDIKPIQEPQYNVRQDYTAALQAQSQALLQAQQQQQQRVQQMPQQSQPKPQPNLQQQVQQQQPQTQQPAQQAAQTLPQAQPQPQIQTQPQPQSVTPSNQPAAVAPPTEPAQTQESAAQSEALIQNNDAVDSNDIDMGDLGDPEGNDNTDGNEWDMVNDQPSGNNSQSPQGNVNNQQQQALQSDSEQQNVDESQSQQAYQADNNTPAGEANDFDMVNDFDTNMDTAGDALADYNVDDDLNLDDSAFGDAFHHNQQDLS